MYILTANDWRDDYKPKSNPPTKKEHNNRMKESAEYYAGEMRKNPSVLEKMMMEFLDNNHVDYEFQRIFYIRDKAGFILKYYIADFYIPRRKIAIEMDGKFHEKQKIEDENRSKDIQRQYTKVKIMRFCFKDMYNYKKLKSLIGNIKSSTHS